MRLRNPLCRGDPLCRLLYLGVVVSVLMVAGLALGAWNAFTLSRSLAEHRETDRQRAADVKVDLEERAKSLAAALKGVEDVGDRQHQEQVEQISAQVAELLARQANLVTELEAGPAGGRGTRGPAGPPGPPGAAAPPAPPPPPPPATTTTMTTTTTTVAPAPPCIAVAGTCLVPVG
ncbi:MAG: hypothetical protein LC798_05310 [Chloroflexi bacterium]|nr:hypothetical protein [Chloroflexota bacterium]